MTIHPDVARIARRFAGASKTFPRLIQSVVIAEGGTLAHLLRAVRCSTPSCQGTDEAIEITCRSAIHALSDYAAAHSGPEFVSAWGAKWAPIGAKNDPTALNKNWSVNVATLWLKP